jgi:hypothetical protein
MDGDIQGFEVLSPLQVSCDLHAVLSLLIVSLREMSGSFRT